MTSIYHPSEDSYFLSNILEKQIPILLRIKPKLKILEIGIGSGIQLLTLKKLGVNDIIGVDINSEAVKHCKKLGFNCLTSNLFSKVKAKFDLIIFNPPYLPKDLNELKDSRVSTTGGEIGNEIIIKFLKQAKNHLKDKGRIFLLVSSLTPKINFNKFGYNGKLLGNEKLFFEELCVWELDKA